MVPIKKLPLRYLALIITSANILPQTSMLSSSIYYICNKHAAHAKLL